LSGDQSESPRGDYDYWIVKIRGNNFVSGSVGNPAVGAVTLDMLSPEVKAKLNAGGADSNGSSAPAKGSVVALEPGQTPPAGYTAITEEGIDWKIEPAGPNENWASQTAIIGNDVYFISGSSHYPNNSNYYGESGRSTVRRYNLITKTTTTLAGYTESRRVGAVVAFNDEIYAIGGYRWQNAVPGRSNVYIYNPGTDSWRTGVPFPHKIFYAGAEVLGNRIYVWGGIIDPSEQSQAYNSKTYYLEQGASEWVELDTGVPHCVDSSFVHNGIIYSLSGSLSFAKSTNEIVSGEGYSSKLDKFDPNASTWTELTWGPKVSGASAFYLGGKIFIVGGTEAEDSFLHSYDLTTGAVRPVRTELFPSNTEAVRYPSAFAFDNKVMVTGGYRFPGGSPGVGAGTYIGTLSKALYVADGNATGGGGGSGGGTPSAGSVTLDMLSPEVKARLNPPSPAPLGATLANPYGWGGTPIIGEQEVYVVPDGKVLVMMSSDGLPVKIEDITVNGTTKRFRGNESPPSIIPAGTKVLNQSSGWAGMLYEQLEGVTPVISRGENYTVPSGKVLVLTSSRGSITTPSAYGAKGFRTSESWPSILPSGTQVISGNADWGWSGYLKDN
jgi:hypothetical protein